MPADDREQILLDLEDAQHRLGAMRRAIQARDEAEAIVRRLSQFLAQAKRKLKEAGWNLACLLHVERRKG